MGDFNIDYLRKQNVATGKLLKWEKDLFLPQLIKEKTRVCETTSTCIDLIFTNIRHIMKAGVLGVHLSDHKPIFVIKKKARNEFQAKKLQTRGSSFDYDNLEYELSACDWSFVAHETNPSVLWDRMFDNIQMVVNKLYSLCEFRVKKNRPEYMNDDIIRLGKERDAAFEKAASSKSKEDWEEVQKARRKANSSLRKSKYTFINDNIEDACGDPKRFWRQIRLLIPNVQSQMVDYIIGKDGISPLRGKDACNRINVYFCNISKDLAGKLSQNVPERLLVDNTNLSQIWSFEIGRDEVLDHIEN